MKASRHAPLRFFNTDSGRNRDDCFCLERAESEECKSMLVDVGVDVVLDDQSRRRKGLLVRGEDLIWFDLI